MLPKESTAIPADAGVVKDVNRAPEGLYMLIRLLTLSVTYTLPEESTATPYAYPFAVAVQGAGVVWIPLEVYFRSRLLVTSVTYTLPEESTATPDGFPVVGQVVILCPVESYLRTKL